MHDIRELLETGKGQAPPPPYDVDDLVAAGNRRRRRAVAARIGGAGIVAAALATAGLLIGSNVMLPANHPAIVGKPDTVKPYVEPAAPGVDIPPLTFMFNGYSAGAFRVLPPQEVTTTYQASNIVADYRDSSGSKTIAYVGTLTVYRPGVRPPAQFTFGTPIMVHGQPGFAYTRDQDMNSIVNGGGVFANPRDIKANTLSWQYAPNGWVVIDSVIQIPADEAHRMSAVDERALADAFSFGTPEKARIPFQYGTLPAGWQVVSVAGRSFTAEDLPSVTVILAPASAAGPDKVRHFANEADGSAVVVTILHNQIPPPDAPKTKQTCGHLETDTDLACSGAIAHTDYGFVVHDPANVLTSAALIAFGQSLTFDNLNQPTTWHTIP
jgi:hypothetical protein